jgi:hypothetical protein
MKLFLLLLVMVVIVVTVMVVMVVMEEMMMWWEEDEDKFARKVATFNLRRIWGPHGIGYEEFYLLECMYVL